jgi:DNA repair protein RecN (Recombination protein N)
MLTSLSIRDVVLIDRLDLIFDSGLGVVTGETGAGKSILLDALGLALGARADQSLVRDGCDLAIVTAIFDLPANHPARAIMAEQEIADEGELILRRQIGRDGRSRAFANDQPISVSLLRSLGDGLVEIHGQHDDRGLLDPSGHRALLDLFGGLDALVSDIRTAYVNRLEARRALAEAQAELARAQADEEYLRHVSAELSALDAKIGEEQRLAEERQHLIAAEKLSKVLEEVIDLVDGDAGAIIKLSQALRRLERGAEGIGQALAPTLGALSRAVVEAQEASEALGAATRNFIMDPRKLERSEERLFALRAAARKHNVTCDGLSGLAASFAQKLLAIDRGGANIAALSATLAKCESAYQAAAEKLTAARQRAAVRLDKAVAGELKPLKLDSAKFRTAVEPMTEGGPDGADRVNFEISTNPGAPFGPLTRIASGGELSRFILALKVALSRQGSAGTLIFDEVDRGIGGAVAAAVGERLARLSSSAQVLVVTHSPQVAARANHHWRISKSERGGRAVTRVEPLEPKGRQEEIARMIAGATITDEARAAAAALLKDQTA